MDSANPKVRNRTFCPQSGRRACPRHRGNPVVYPFDGGQTNAMAELATNMICSFAPTRNDAMPSQGAVENIASPTSLVHGGSRSNVLIVDGDKDCRQIYADVLRSKGFRTLCAQDHVQAWAVLQHEHIDIAVIDMMPKTNGMTVCRDLKSNPQTQMVPILLLSSWEFEPGIFLGVESGADACLKKPFADFELVDRVRTLLDSNIENAEKVVLTLAQMVEAKNPYIAGHGYRVSQIAVVVANRIGLSLEEREWVRRGALVHDIGNAGVPDEILNKSGPLTAEEKIILNSHTYLGERICAPLTSCRALPQIVRNHHERLDGSGYPDGLRGSQISIWTQLVSLADVYDSLTARRPYRGSFSHTQAMHQMRREAEQGWWDRHLVDELGNLAN